MKGVRNPFLASTMTTTPRKNHPKKKQTISSDNILYKCGWSPFEGETFNSVITHTFVNGHLAYNNGNLDDSKLGMKISFNNEN